MLNRVVTFCYSMTVANGVNIPEPKSYFVLARPIGESHGHILNLNIQTTKEVEGRTRHG